MVFVFSFLLVSSLIGCGWLTDGSLLVAIQGAQQRPDKPAEFTRNGDFGFVALETAAEQLNEAQVQTGLRLPAELANCFRLALLALGEFFADFRRQEVVLGALGQ